MDRAFPPFAPHALLRGGDAQTLAGALLPGRRRRYSATRRSVGLPDGDVLVLHDDVPAGWSAGDPVAVLLHGLGGSYESPYLARTAAKLTTRGVRAVRMDMRGCGAAAGQARLPAHGGRSADLLAALLEVERLCAGSPLSVAGFSLGGNVLLKLLGEAAETLPSALRRAVAVSPALDLAACARELGRPRNRLYDRHFTRVLLRSLANSDRLARGERLLAASRPPRSVYEFDDLYTAPVCGFASADEYYARCSAARVVPRITLPTIILTADDDPLVPCGPFRELAVPSAARLHITRGGGHVGWLGRGGVDPDRRWMEWRVAAWLA